MQRVGRVWSPEETAESRPTERVGPRLPQGVDQRGRQPVAAVRWHAAGTPALEEFTVSVTPQGQTINW
ncbi:hypothetical protein [Streptomyces sp. OV198]|uniref:hypothetical protein n=1 Tax=Streptomyces sp. OV198 TaxID=1882787 RepID=UPI000BE238FA|nr:hypothetical protein [Streptomyces sp. OV198]